MKEKPGVHTFSKNLQVITKFQVVEAWHEARFILRTDKY